MQESEAVKHEESGWRLTLYVAGDGPKTHQAFSNLTTICEEHLAGQYVIQVVDIMADPHAAKQHEIMAVPTVVRAWPGPIRKIVGDLSDREAVMQGLGLR